MSEYSLQLIDAVRRRLSVARRRVTFGHVAFGLLVTIGLSALLIGVGGFLEGVFWMGPGTRLVLLVLILLSLLAVLGWFVIVPLLRAAGWMSGMDDRSLAAAAGGRYPEVADRLQNLLDLADGRGGRSSPPLVDGAVQMLARHVEPVPFEHLEDRERIRRVAPAAAVPVVGVMLALLVAPGFFGEGVQRLLTPTASFARPAPFQLTIEPGDAEIVHGGTLDVVVRAEGSTRPRSVDLELRREGESRAAQLRLLADDEGNYHHAEENVRSSFEYRAVAEGVTSPWHSVTVHRRPVVGSLQVTLRPPAYTGLPPQRLAPNVGDISALPGTQADLEITLDGPRPDSAALVFDSGLTIELDQRGRQAHGRVTVRAADTYHVDLQSSDGHRNADPIPYAIRPLTDAPPQIRLLEPVDRVLTENLVTRVAARVTDDFGFSRAALAYRLAERDGSNVESDFEELDIPIQPDLLDQDIAREWLLGAANLDLRPGDVVAFYVEVWDNNAVAGYQSATTGVHHLRFPTVVEQFDRLDESEDQTRGTLEQMREEVDEARSEFDELRQRILQNQHADWEDERALERLMRQQEQMQEMVEDASQQMHDVLDRMRENDLVDEETARLYEELQRVIEEVADPDLLEQLQQLQEAMQEMNLEQMLQSMDQFDFDEQNFRERLERALELFERLRTARELEEAAARAGDIAEQEERLSEETGKLQDDESLSEEQQQAEQDRLADEQQRAQEAAEALQEQLDQLMERLEQQGHGEEMMQELENQQQQLQDAMQEMQQNQQQLQDGELQDAQQGQQSLQEAMEQMQQALMDMGQQMSGQQQQRNTTGIRQALENVLTLSFDQEDLRERVVGQRPDSPAVRQVASRQVDLSAGLSMVLDSLNALAREIPQMQRAIQERAGGAVREMSQATELLADRQPPQAAGFQKGAMTSLNDLALLLSDLLDEMSGGEGSGGGEMSLQQMLQQMQEMGEDQQMLNQQLQQMLNDMQGQRLTVDQQQRLQQMQEAQQQLQEQLEELIQQGALDSQTQSELQRIAEEMEEVARRMESGRLDRDLREQQDRILSRLLEAYESLNERGQREEREGASPEEFDRSTPPADLPEQDEVDRLRRDLIRALESGYAPDYQELIKRYFDLLQQRVDED